MSNSSGAFIWHRQSMPILTTNNNTHNHTSCATALNIGFDRGEPPRQTGVRLPILPAPNLKQLNFQGTSRSARSHTQRASIFNRRFWESENDTSLFLFYTLNCVFM